MPIQWWVSLSLAMVAIAVSPGNGAVLSMRYGLKGGVRYASPAIMGLQLGLLGVYGIVLISLMITTHISPHIIDAIALLGGGYLIYLGGRDIWNAQYKPEASSPLAAQLTDNAGYIPQESWGKRVTAGLFTNLTNPKGIVFMAAFFPGWLDASAPWSLTKQAIAMGCVAVIIDTTVMHSYAYLASIIRHFLTDPHLFHMVEIILGAILCFIGIGMVFVRFF